MSFPGRLSTWPHFEPTQGGRESKKITRVVYHFCETLSPHPHEVSEFSAFSLRHGACSREYSPRG
jgi:hypothetical protein